MTCTADDVFYANWPIYVLMSGIPVLQYYRDVLTKRLSYRERLDLSR